MTPSPRPPGPFAPAALALAQLSDPALFSAVLASVGWAVAALLLLGAALGWGGASLVGGWLAAHPTLAEAAAWIAGAAGVLGVALAALFAFVPLATGIATLFTDRVASAVERRHLPALPPAQPASLAAQAWDGAALALLVAAMQVVALLAALLLPGLGLGLGWLVAAWAIGRGLFMAVALRRCNRAQALLLYRRRRLAVLVHGGLVAAAGLVPGMNLLAPVLGLAAMVHILGAGPFAGPLPGRIDPARGLSGRGGAW
jgi:CysZ protein